MLTVSRPIGAHFYVVVAAFLFWSTAHHCSPVLGKTLEVGIEHTEIMPSVSQELRKGGRFSLSAVENEPQSNEWILLPDWMCGTWRLDRETSVFRHDFKKNVTASTKFTYNAHHQFHYGMQQDRNGGIWHYIGTPYHSKTQMAEFDEHHLVRTKKFNRADEQAVSFTTEMNVVRTEMGTYIVDSFQQESITSYTPNPQAPGYINMSASSKSFDANGQPWRQSDNIAKIKQVTPFTEVKTYHGKDMRVLFREFLLSKGWTNLLPD